MSDAPIEPHEYLRRKGRPDRVLRWHEAYPTPLSSCRHRKMVYDERERRIWCSDCETEVEPFDAFMHLVQVFDGGEGLEQAPRELRGRAVAIRSRAAR